MVTEVWRLWDPAPKGKVVELSRGPSGVFEETPANAAIRLLARSCADCANLGEAQPIL